MIYKGRYKHKDYHLPIDVLNDGRYLTVSIGDATFKGSEFTDLCYQGNEVISNNEFYSVTKDQRRSLCNCTLELDILQFLCCSGQTEQPIPIQLRLAAEIGNYTLEKQSIAHEGICLSFDLGKSTLCGKGDTIETAFDQVVKQLPQGYYFKNCYGCLYGDYSIYGNSAFGTMMCFSQLQEHYKNVTNKIEYEILCQEERDKIAIVQEIALCEKFEVRGVKGAFR
ncbi:DUF6304 family protein [Myroides albus]|uniref:Uncharacterized protein n=1 Tax=Myroides albus TaxID=2562892 RepID=A0A6I3LJR6_9FLAO|nr:DUF6304 family protein [Myroides albus]MTG98828.1 hypothetical protein [Myroides albus]UVD80475.1 DUF6304 family protein [Myroides albus]